MPRKLSEWQAIRDNYYKATKIDFPLPGIESIVYQRESDNLFWEKRRENASKYIPSSLHFNFEDGRIEQFIRSAAQQERAKEESFLDQFYKDDGHGADSPIDKFNIMFQSREIYEEQNKRIKEILDSRQFNPNKTYTDANGATHEYFTGLAPNLSAVFMSYFVTHFRRRLTSNKVPTTYAEFNAMIERAVLGASRQMANIVEENANQHGWGQEWQPVLDALQRGGPEKEWFMSTLRNAIGESNLQKLYNSIHGSQKVKIRRKDLESTLGISKQGARVGGSIVEVVTAIFANAVNGVNNPDFKMYAKNFGASTEMTDMMQLWTTDVSLDLSVLTEQLQQQMGGLGSDKMRQMYQRIQKWYDDQQQNMDKLWMVYTNAKNKGIGAEGTNVDKKYHGMVEELPEFLSANGISVDAAQQFLAFAYNTARGAIRDNQRGWLEENIVNALKAAATKIMFDDYQSIGQGDQKAIHMYYLSGKYIPASYVLNAMADAAVAGNINAKADVQLPSSINDHGPEWGNLSHDSDAAFKEALYNYWQEEYKEAKQSATWSMTFTLRIKEILGNSF